MEKIPIPCMGKMNEMQRTMRSLEIEHFAGK
jgi:hypothetical protein